jgi:hypothetical protein
VMANPRDAPAAPMSSGIIAFAGRFDYICAYCLRQGSQVGDPDGHSWWKDQVAVHLRNPQNPADDLVLACSACKGTPSRQLP